MSKKDLSGLFVNDVKIPRHDRDLLVSYMKLLDIANVDYTVNATNDEYKMTLDTEPTPKIITGTIKTDKISDGSSVVESLPYIHEKYRDTLGVSESSLNENVAKAISNIESLSTDSAKIGNIANIANIGITSAKIRNLPDLEFIGNKIGAFTNKPKSRHYVRLFTLNNDDYYQRIPGPGYGRTVNGRISDITKGEYLRAFELFISMYNISEATYNNKTFIRVKAGEGHNYFERIESAGGIVYKEVPLELFEQAFSDSAFMKKASDGTILNDTV